MIDNDMTEDPRPECFGDLEKVFPVSRNGLRETPDDCMYLCAHKTPCLRSAMAGDRGIDVKEEILERGEKAGMMGFFERWSRKKQLHKQRSGGDNEKR